LMAIRFTLGIVEAAVMPAMLIYISNWFTKSERSRANTFLILGNPVTVLWMSIVSGYLIQAWGWREMFIIEGIPAVLWAFCWWALVRDKPSEATWLSEEEKQTLQQAMDSEQTAIKPVRNYGEAMRSRNVIMPVCRARAVEYWRLRLHDVDAVDSEKCGANGHCLRRLAGRSALPCGDLPDAGGFMALR
jgi:Sugar phosphate permease